MRLYRACGAGEQSGVALVEFALVLPVLMLLLIGMIEFGKAFNYWIDETQMASSGARWAVVNKQPDPACTYPADALCLQKYIQGQADTTELRNGGTSSVKKNAQVCITFPNGGTPKVGDPVKVTVSVTYNWLPLIGQKIAAVATTIAGSATQRLEAVPTNYSAGCSPT